MIKDEWFQAVVNGDEKKIDFFLKPKVDINIQDKYGCTALMYACQEGNDSLVTFLLEHGSNVHLSDEEGNTALMKTHKTGILKALLAKGACLEAKNYAGETALICACGDRFFEQAEVVGLLLEQGADVNSSDDMGITPLMRASQKGYEDIVQLLLKYNSSLNLTNKSGQSAYDLAAHYGHNTIMQLLKSSIINSIVNEKKIHSKKTGFQVQEDIERNTGDLSEKMPLMLHKEEIESFLNTLSERESKILVLRLGMESSIPLSVAEVAKLFNVTEERISQLEAKTMRKLRHFISVKNGDNSQEKE